MINLSIVMYGGDIMDANLIHQLFHHLHWQAQKLMQLESSLQNISREMESIKNQPTTPKIDKIDYNFDQLKIEKLEGTLNIGITPNSGKSIEDFSINGQALDERSTGSIQNKINDFLQTDMPAEIERLSGEFNIILDQERFSLIIEDLKKQTEERIRYYSSEAAIVEKVKNDMLIGVNQYFKNLSESERESQ
jgi:spore germination protein PC